MFFGAHWCSHCQAFRPTYEKFAQQIKSIQSSTSDDRVKNLLIARVECPENSALCQRFSIYGYPTVKYLSQQNIVYEYKQPRVLETMLSWATEGWDKLPGTEYPATTSALDSDISASLNAFSEEPVISAFVIGTVLVLVVVSLFAIIVYLQKGNSSQPSSKRR